MTRMKTTFRESSSTPVFIFLFACSVRLFYLHGFQNSPFFDYIPKAWDQTSYDNAAQAFAAGDYFLLKSGREQFSYFYKFFLGIIYAVAGRNFFLIWSAQFLFGALSAVLVYLIALRLFDRKVALASSVLFSLYGPQIYYEGILYREFMVTFLVLLTCHALLRYTDRPNNGRLAWAALSFSLLVQCRPNLALLCPFICWYLLAPARDGIRSWKPVFTFIAITLVAAIPLATHMIYLYERFVFLDDSGPRTLLLGNLVDYPGKEWLPQLYSSFENRERGDIRSYSGVVAYVLPQIIENPADFASLYARKTFYFFNDYEAPSSMNYHLLRSYSPILSSPFAHFAVYGAMGLAGMVLLARQWHRYRILYFFSAGIFVSVVSFYIVARFRLPIVPFLMMFSAYAFFYFVENWRKFSAGIFPAVLVAVLFYSLTIPKSLVLIRAIDYANLGALYAKNQRFQDVDRALELYVKGWNISARAGHARNQVRDYLEPFLHNEGKNHYLHRRYRQAVAWLRRSTAVHYENSATHADLSGALRESGRVEEAIFHAQESLLIDPTGARGHLMLMQLFMIKTDYIKALFHGRKALALAQDEQKKKSMENMLKPLEGLVASLGNKPPRLDLPRIKSLVESGEWSLGDLASLAASTREPEFYVLLGDVYLHENVDASAFEAYRNALVLDPGQPQLYANMGILAKKMGRRAEAVLYYRKALEYFPDRADFAMAVEDLEARHAVTSFEQLVQGF